MATIIRLGLENAAVATLLALIVTALRPALRRKPAVLHCLWLIVLLKLVTPPIWRPPVLPGLGPVAPAGETRTTELESAYQILSDASGADLDVLVGVRGAGDRGAVDEVTSPVPFLPTRPQADLVRAPTEKAIEAVGVVWMVGSLLCGGLAVVRVRQFYKVLGLIKPAPEEVEDLLWEAADGVGLGRCPRVGMLSGLVSPMVWSPGLSPVLVLPSDLWSRLDDRQRVTLLTHELAHLKRGDHLVRLLETAVTTLDWWLPVVWWARHALHEAEEQCCDAWVVWAYPEAARAYAETLMETVDFLSQDRSPVPAFASGLGRVRQLKTRLQMIMWGTTSRTLGLGGTLAAVWASALVLPLSPTWAQKPETKPGEKTTRIIVRDNDEGQPGQFFRTATAKGDEENRFRVIVRDDEEQPGQFFRTAIAWADDEDEKPAASKARVGAKEETKRQVRIVVKGDDADGKGGKKEDVLTIEIGDDGTPEAHARAMKQATEKLADQLKVLKAQRGNSASDKQRAEALSRAIEALSRSASKADSARSVHQLHVERFESADRAAHSADEAASSADVKKKELTAEQTATRDELRAQMKKLQAEAEAASKEMREVGQKMAEAHRKLADASRKLAALEGGPRGNGTYRVTRPLTGKPGVVEIRPDVTGARSVREIPVTPRLDLRRSNAPENDRRIDALEKKLEEVLKSLDSIKKQGDRKSDRE